LTQAEELVQAASDDGEEEADSPHAGSVHGQRLVIDGLDDGAHLQEGRVVGLVRKGLLGIPIAQDGNMVFVVAVIVGPFGSAL
jgi:hypothetical protein